MTRVLVMAAMLVGCAGEPANARYCIENGPTFCAEIGDECDAEAYCAGGEGWCHAGRCEPFCADTGEFCSSGPATWVKTSISAVCLCIQ
jgi:hypothetical protein